jgi:hypothetical protein
MLVARVIGKEAAMRQVQHQLTERKHVAVTTDSRTIEAMRVAENRGYDAYERDSFGTDILHTDDGDPPPAYKQH